MLRAKRVKAFSRSPGVTWYLHPFPSTVTWIKSPVSITAYWDESNDDAKPILEFSSIWMIPVSKPSPSEDASAKWGDTASDFLPLLPKMSTHLGCILAIIFRWCWRKMKSLFSLKDRVRRPH